MKLRYLETFVVVADELHFGRAAARLHVAQPAVSQTIAALEEELGVRLFDRSRRQVRLTAAGTAYRAEAEAVLRRLSQAGDLARRADAGVSGRLVVGFTTVCAISGLAAFLTRFLHAEPEVQVQLLPMDTRAQVEALVLGQLDLGFTVEPLDDPALTVERVFDDALHAFVPRTHRFADQDRVAVAELLTEPLLLMSREREPAMHQALAHLCRRYDVRPDVVLEVDQLDTMLAFVAGGLGVSLAPSSAARLQLEGVVDRPLSPPIEAGVSVMWTALSPVAARVVAQLRERRDAVRAARSAPGGS